MSESFQTGWGPRLLGLTVLLAVLAVAGSLAAGGGAPVWTWLLLGCFGLAALLATVANFGDRWIVDDEGLAYRNDWTARIGWPRSRRAAWSDVMEARDYEGRTWFVIVEGQKRWVIDQLRDHERLRVVFQQRGVSVSSIEKPRLWRRDPMDPGR